MLVQGDVAGINDIITHWLTTGIDPLAAQISKEFSRKLIPKTDWLRGDRVYADTSTIQHFDMFSNAANIEKSLRVPHTASTSCARPPAAHRCLMNGLTSTG